MVSSLVMLISSKLLRWLSRSHTLCLLFVTLYPLLLSSICLCSPLSCIFLITFHSSFSFFPAERCSSRCYFPKEHNKHFAMQQCPTGKNMCHFCTRSVFDDSKGKIHLHAFSHHGDLSEMTHGDILH